MNICKKNIPFILHIFDIHFLQNWKIGKPWHVVQYIWTKLACTYFGRSKCGECDFAYLVIFTLKFIAVYGKVFIRLCRQAMKLGFHVASLTQKKKRDVLCFYSVKDTENFEVNLIANKGIADQTKTYDGVSFTDIHIVKCKSSNRIRLLWKSVYKFNRNALNNIIRSASETIEVTD